MTRTAKVIIPRGCGILDRLLRLHGDWRPVRCRFLGQVVGVFRIEVLDVCWYAAFDRDIVVMARLALHPVITT